MKNNMDDIKVKVSIIIPEIQKRALLAGKFLGEITLEHL